MLKENDAIRLQISKRIRETDKIYQDQIWLKQVYKMRSSRMYQHFKDHRSQNNTTQNHNAELYFPFGAGNHLKMSTVVRTFTSSSHISRKFLTKSSTMRQLMGSNGKRICAKNKKVVHPRGLGKRSLIMAQCSSR